MSTRLSVRNLFPPLDNPELTIQRRSRADPTVLNEFEMATEGNGDPLVPDLRTTEELCQPSLNGRDTFYNGLTLKHRDTIDAAAGGTFMKRRPEECYDLIKNMTTHHNDWDTSAQRTTVFPTQNAYAAGAYQGGISYQPQGNTITNPNEDLKGITTRSGNAYQGPTIPTTSFSLPKVVEHETEVTKDMVPPTNNESTKDVQPLVIQIKNPIQNSEPAVTPIIEPVVPPLPEKLGDPSKFLIPCDFLRMDECLALIDLGVSINLMPLSVWNKLSLPKLSPTCMTLELTDRSISRLVGVVKDVFVKVETFHFPADFVVVDFDVDPRVPLILRRSFLKTGRALIDVFEGELTLRVGKEAITFNLNQTSRYSANYNDMTANRIDVIDIACEDYLQEVLGFFNVIVSGNPTLYYDPIVSTSSSTLTPFRDSDFLLEEFDAFLALEDDPTSSKVDHFYFNTEGDILLLEAFLNDDSSLPPPNQVNYLPQVRKELKIYEAKNDKSSIYEPLEVELKYLPSHLEYAFLEKDYKFPVIIAKGLSDKEKTTLIKSLGEPHTLCTKKGGFTVVENEENGLIPTRLVTGWRVCIDYRKLNEATRKDHSSLPFMDQMLERLAGNEYYCFLDGFSDTNLCLNWEKSHFMVKEGIVLGHKTSKNGIEVYKAKVDAIAKLPHLTTVKGIHSFLGHVGFYRRFIQDFLKIARLMTPLLEKDTPFFFSKECVEAFQTLKRKLTEALILIASDWDLPFELMYDASDFP
nr:reverse transcriptase domain-containing protein [Tanacetum cinerariifolium]